MLGSQSWYVALAVPTIIIGGFVASRKRLSYQWKEELMDPEGNMYPPLTFVDMEHVRHVAPVDALEDPSKPQNIGKPVDINENIGIHIVPDLFREEQTNVLLNEIKEWSDSLGNLIDTRKVDVFNNTMEKFAEEIRNNSAYVTLKKILSPSEFDAKFYGEVKVISDHAEDIQQMKAPWGCGDRLDYGAMPSVLRHMVNTAQQKFELLGRLRHVYIEYSPSGKFYRDPKPAKHFDGHDMVILPLRRDDKPSVVTFSPLFRSKYSFLPDVMYHSWTNRDIDCCIPSGSAARVYGKARYEWGWGIRPGKVWFGSRHNMVQESTPTAIFEKLWKHFKLGNSADKKNWSKTSDAALVVMHFEGPRKKNKQRSLFLEPEIWIFGRAPTPETFEQWVEKRPTADTVRQEGIVRFLITNYFSMLNVS